MRSSFFLCAVLLLPSPLIAQRATVEFLPGGPSRNGFAEASVEVEYGLLACAGDIWITMGVDRRSYRTSSVYWYEGQDYPAPSPAGTPS